MYGWVTISHVNNILSIAVNNLLKHTTCDGAAKWLKMKFIYDYEKQALISAYAVQMDNLKLGV